MVTSPDAKPSIDILGIHLMGAPAAVAFLVSLISVGRAAIDALSWLRHKLVPIKLEAFAWDPKADSAKAQEWPTQLRINVHNGNKQASDLLRLEVLYDPGWWRRRKPGWTEKAKSPLGLQIESVEKRQLPVGWSTIYPVVIHAASEHEQLIVVAGFKMKHVRAVRPEPLQTPIYVPRREPAGIEPGRV